jgi:hypothetical protein
VPIRSRACRGIDDSGRGGATQGLGSHKFRSTTIKVRSFDEFEDCVSSVSCGRLICAALERFSAFAKYIVHVIIAIGVGDCLI